jgi:hypothetical protein
MSLRHRALHHLDEMWWGTKAKSDRVADIQVSDARARSLDPLSLHDDVPDGIGKLADAASDRDNCIGRPHGTDINARAHARADV